MNKHIQARDILWKLGQHPALPEHLFSPLSLMHIDIMEICKNGHCRPFKGCITIHYNPKNYKLYKKEFDEEFKDYTPEELKIEKGLTRVDIPYTQVYGYPWKFDHIEYWSELVWKAYRGKDFVNGFKKDLDYRLWDSYCGVESGGNTFEDMIVNTGRKFFKNFGKFTKEDFLTAEEKANHEKEWAMITYKKDERFSYMKSNPKYIRVTDAEINRRWIKWFAGTAYGEKHWGESLKEIIEGKDAR
jgi:hypothetical protein